LNLTKLKGDKQISAYNEHLPEPFFLLIRLVPKELKFQKKKKEKKKRKKKERKKKRKKKRRKRRKGKY
jgi:hypothetical protein